MRILVLGGIVAGLVALSGTAMADTTTATAAPTPQAAAVAQATPAAQTTAAATTEADLDRVVCKTNSAVTGTRLGSSRSCHTQREWDRMRQEQQNHLTQMQIDKGMPASH